VIDVGIVKEVIQDPGDPAIFLLVELRHYSRRDGQPCRARVRWCPVYHGAGFGDWWVPPLELDVLCAFPGLGPDGRADDIDEGFAWCAISTSQEPPVAGLVGALSATRRVAKGRSGEALDRHVQGDLDAKVEGKETRETVGVFSRVLRAAATWAGDALVKLISQSKITLVAPTVTLGGENAVKTLVHEDFLTLFNAHVHSGGGNPPTVPAVIGTHSTTKTKAE
jgi:hypothetical protein